MAFDGLSLKALSYEFKQLIGYKIDKVFEPNKNNIVLGLYGNNTKFALNICIDSKFYRINLTTHPKPNPMQSLNFCMLLRKHIIGYKIKNILTYGLERLIIFELEPFDGYEKNIKYLIVELMGKHSNIILTDNNKVIIDSIRHTNTSSNSYRNIFPKQIYQLPKSDKLNIEDITNFEKFYEIISPDLEANSLEKSISNKFTGLSMSSIKFFMQNSNNSSVESAKHVFVMIKNILKEAENSNVHFEQIDENDYCLALNKTQSQPFCLNFFIDDFYYKKESAFDFITYRNSILKLILDKLKKYNKRLLNINAKLIDCDNKNTYQLYGELLTANLYKFNNEHLENVEVLNYNTGKTVIIPLDKTYTVNENCKRYYKKYNKLKNALNIVEKQKKETENELKYIESVVFELESAKSIEEVNMIYDEIAENSLFKSKSNVAKKKTNAKKKKNRQLSTFNPLTFVINGYTVLVGRNNKENDWLTTKYASSNDLWFHTKNIHGSHVILRTEGYSKIDVDILLECAKLAAKHSKGKNSANVPVDYALVKYVKKPHSAKPGMVIYTHNKTLYVTP